MRAPLLFLPTAITSSLLWILLVSTQAATIDLADNQPAQDTCKEDIASSRLSPTFFNSIAHALHSITVEDLQFYFNANANETNNIPTVNQDRLSDDAILNHAPKSGSEFRSQAMKTMDMVLSHMDEKMWGPKNYNTLEKIIHAFHMQEMWSESSVIYKEMLKEPPTEVSLCSCLKDVEHNGVFHELRVLGLYIREPVLMYNMDERLESQEDGQQGRMGRSRKFRKEDRFYRQGRKLSETSTDDINLVDEASWQVKKTEYLKPRDTTVAYEQALYFYCMLEQ